MALKKASAPAYYLVDLSELTEEDRQQIIDDAMFNNGLDYGVQICEEVHNGPARVPLYGVYYGPNEEKWANAQKQFGTEVEPTDPTDAGASTLEAAKTAAADQAEAADAADAATAAGIGANKAQR